MGAKRHEGGGSGLGSEKRVESRGQDGPGPSEVRRESGAP